MENQLIEIATSQGIWAALSIFLILYILKVQKERDSKQEEIEKNYKSIMVGLTKKFSIIEDMDRNIKNIKMDTEILRNKGK